MTGPYTEQDVTDIVGEITRLRPGHCQGFTTCAYDVRVTLDWLASRGRLVTPPGQRGTDHDLIPCEYVSTACTHARRDAIPELHGRCRLSCKWCGTVCQCPDCKHEEASDAA